MTLRRRGGETFIFGVLSLARVKLMVRWEWANTGGQPVADWGWAEEPFNSDEENCLAWSVSSSSSFW